MNGNAQQEQLQQIAIAQIADSTTNPRKSFAGMEDLKASIGEGGIRVPLLVRSAILADGSGPSYQLVCGARRLRAARELELETVPCIVRHLTDEEARETQIVENLQRADVHPAEEAEAYAAMIEDAAAWTKPGEPARVGVTLTAEDVAKRVGKPAGYVAQRLKLLALSLDAKLLFVREHLTLGHALLLARLTEKDQGRALMWLLDCDPKYVKAPLTEIVRGKLDRVRVEEGEGADVAEGVEPGECRFCGCTEDDACPQGCSWVDDARTVCSTAECVEAWEDQKREPQEDRPTVPKIAKYMRDGGRLIDATEAQLKRWVEANVLLKLADVPWRLDDAALVVAAGPCTACPKRSGSNAALFGDLTAAEDVCLDPACFTGKQDAVVKLHKMAARKGGAEALLKISAKTSREKLEEPAVSAIDDRKNAIGKITIHVTAKTIRAGQWVAAELGSCPTAVQGLMVDGADKGKLFPVCADQSCKVHKHEVYRPGGGGGGHSQAEYDRQAKEREEQEQKYVAAEAPVRLAVYAAIKQKAKVTADDVLRGLALRALGDPEPVCVVAGVKLPPMKNDWTRRDKVQAILVAEIKKRSGVELLSLTFDVLHARDLYVRSHMYRNRKADREDAWKLAKQYGVDADAIAKQMEPKVAKPGKTVAPAKVKKAAKAPVKKKAATKPAKKKPKKG